MATPFSGGDHLSANDGLKYYIHKTMMLNELNGGTGAYQMSNAVLAASGPSFGPIQYDLGSNGRGRALFESIAGSATDGKGERILSDDELKEIKDNFFQPFNKMSAAQTARYGELKPKIDLALGSDEGIRQIDADYDKVLDEKVKYVDDVIAGVTNQENREYLRGDVKAQVQVADIKNQYGTAVNTALKAFLNQSSDDDGVQIPKGGDLVKVEEVFDSEDIKAFRMGTAYGKDHPKDARRRESNIDQVTKGAVIGDEGKAIESPSPQQHSKAVQSSGNLGVLLPESRRLLQESEQHVRALADRHQLRWDQGMDNTVWSIAQQAREQGLTGITHFKAAGGQIRFAQLDAGVLKEGQMDAWLAANTDADNSMSRLVQMDQMRSHDAPVHGNSPLQGMEAAVLAR